MTSDQSVTVLNPAYWTDHAAQLAKVLRSAGKVPSTIPDPTGKPSAPTSVVTIHDPAYWGGHAAELENALRRGSQSGPARPTTPGVGVAEGQTEQLTLTVEEAATMLGISRAFAYEAVNRGEIPSVRIGRRVLIPRIALERLLDPID